MRLDSTAPRARGGECGARRHPPPRREKRMTEGTEMQGRAVLKPFILQDDWMKGPALNLVPSTFDQVKREA